MERLSNYEEKKITLSSISTQHLSEMAKWGKFLAIVGFATVLLLFTLAIFMGIFLPSLNGNEEINAFQNIEGTPNIGALAAVIGPVLSIVYIVIAVLYFFPMLYLFNFSRKTLSAVKNKDNELIEHALNNLRKHYKFIGIVTLAGILIYALAFIGGLIGGLMA